MTPDERNLITGLFNRLRQADGAVGNKDAEALQLIQQQTTALPSAPYLLVQTLLVQEHALTNAQTRIADLERQVADARQQSGPAHEPEGSGSFLGNLIKRATGGSSPQPPPLPTPAPNPGMRQPPAAPAYPRQDPGQPGGGYAPVPGQPQPPAMPYPTTNTMAPSGGGSFLKSALGTAAGVAGGALLFQGVQNLMGHNAGPFAGGMSGLGGQATGAGQGFLGGGGPGGSGVTEVTNNYYGDNPGGQGGGGSVGDFADGFGGGGGEPGGGSGGGGTVGDFADARGDGGGGNEPGGGFFDSGPEVQDAGFPDQESGNGGGTVGDYMDNGGGDDGGGGGFFDGDGGGSDDSTV